MGSSDNLEKLRKMIDDLDREVLGLLNRRGEIVLRIGELKTENNFRVYDPVRESQIEKRL